jgi:hypothetical protein
MYGKLTRRGFVDKGPLCCSGHIPSRRGRPPGMHLTGPTPNAVQFGFTEPLQHGTAGGVCQRPGRARDESLADLPEFLRQGDFMFPTTDESGYWNLLLQPDMSHVRGAAVLLPGDGVRFPPAGGWMYSLTEARAVLPAEGWGAVGSVRDLINDYAVAARTLPEAQHLCQVVVGLLTALGFTLNLEKCQLQETVAQMEVAGPQVVTARAVAWVAGTIMAIMAMSLAVAPARVGGGPGSLRHVVAPVPRLMSAPAGSMGRSSGGTPAHVCRRR